MKVALPPVVIEEVQHEGHELGLGEDLQYGVEGGAGVVEARLAASPVEELDAGEHVFAVAQNLQHEGLGEAQAELREREVGGAARGQVVVDLGA